MNRDLVRARVLELRERNLKIVEEAETLAFHEELDARAKSKEWILNGLVELANRCMQVVPVMDRNTGKPMLVTGPDGIERQCVAQYNSRDAASGTLLTFDTLGRRGESAGILTSRGCHPSGCIH
jgi:hypothetical protein